MGSATFGDLLGFMLACITLFVTLLLVLIALRLGGDIRDVVERTKKLEDSRIHDSNERTAISSLREIFRRQFDINYRMMLALSMFNLLELEQKDGDISRNVLKADLDRYKTDMDRYLLYLLLLKESEGEELEMRLSNITELYPDEVTIGYFELILPLMTDQSQQVITNATFGLKNRVRGTEASMWGSGLRR